MDVLAIAIMAMIAFPKKIGAAWLAPLIYHTQEELKRLRGRA
jgi:hypothetical protein